MHEIDMNLKDFHRVDLNLLVAFDALMVERSVGKAADRLFVGQPAMSHALSRLRDLFDDPLFVRTGNHMAPTALAETLAPRIHLWLADAGGFLFEPAVFDPARVEATIQIGIPDSLESIIFPQLVASLRRNAPGISMSARHIASDKLLTALDLQDIDLALGTAAERPREWHCHRPLFASRFGCLYSKGQLSISKAPALKQLAQLDHIAYRYRGDVDGIVDEAFQAQGLDRQVIAVSASLIAIAGIVSHAPCVSIQPMTNAPLYKSLFKNELGLTLVPVSDPDLEFKVGMYWHRRTEKSAVHAYLRDLISIGLPKQAR